MESGVLFILGGEGKLIGGVLSLISHQICCKWSNGLECGNCDLYNLANMKFSDDLGKCKLFGACNYSQYCL